MARVEIATQPWGVVQDRAGNTRAGLSFTLTTTVGGAVTRYTTATGGTVDSSTKTNANGEIPGFVEAPGTYIVSVGGVSKQVEALSGSAESGNDFAVVRESPISVLYPEYGAQFDGSTDDHVAINAALAHAETAGPGGEVVMPYGKTIVGGQLVVPSFVTLRGMGAGPRASEYGISAPGATILQLGGAKNFNMIVNADPVGGNAGIRLRDFGFDANTGAVADIAMVKFTRVRRSKILDCAVLGAATTTRRGFWFTASSESNQIRDCFLEGSGIYCDGSNSLRIDDCEVGQAAVYILGGFGHHLVGCEVYKDGISSDDTIPSCVELRDVQEAIVAFNNVRGAYNGHGILLSRGVARSLILANHSYENGRKTVGVWSGIKLDSDTAASPTEKNRVALNHCYDRQATKTQAYGIQVGSASGSQTNNNDIVDNVLLDNATGALDPGTGLVNRIERNDGYVPGAVAVSASGVMPVGSMWSDGTYIYVQTATGTVKRAALATW